MTFPALSNRLVRLSRSSETWDGDRGRPRGDAAPEEYVKTRVAIADLFPELVAIGRALGYDVEIAHVEKVLIGEEDLWPGKPQAGPGEGRRLPFDAQMVFALRPAPP
jgi:hypothetical protein